MKTETLDQILKVISTASQRYELGDGIDNAYQYAVNRVSNDYRVAYQTIGDACRRRLRLDHIGEFKKMLRDSFEGDHSELRAVIERNISQFDSEKVAQFFNDFRKESVKQEPAPKEPDEVTETYTINLKKSDSDILKALAQLLGKQTEEILAEVLVGAVKERMKQAVNHL